VKVRGLVVGANGSSDASTESVQPRFRPGDKVRLVAEPQRRGVITAGPRHHAYGIEYEVTLPDGEEWFAQEHLELVPRMDRPRWVSQDDLLRALTLAKLRHPLTEALYTYRASRTEFQAYQFRPAIKFLQNPNQRILIADEVGLGKTIEAAIIYLELKARTDIRRVAVLCPSRLRRKWRDELQNRFDEDFRILDSSGVDALLDDLERSGPDLPMRIIAPFETLRRPGLAERLMEAKIPLDLLIVDEAHHLRNDDTKTFRVAESLVATADAVVFLTATPLHLRNRDLFNLLNLLAPDEFPREDLFEEQIRPNAAIHRAIRCIQHGDFAAASEALREVEWSILADRFKKDPVYWEILNRLQRFSANPVKCTVRDRVDLQWKLAQLNTLSRIVTRTRKREIQNAAVRAPYSIRVPLTPEERDLYEGVLTVARETANQRGNGAPGFAAIMWERQAASCLAAFRKQLEEGRPLAWHEIELSANDLFAEEEVPNGSGQWVSGLDYLRRLAQRVGNRDSKFETFLSALRQALDETPDSKVLIFSYFKGTLRYLHERLRREGFQVNVIHGDVSIAERQQIIDDFHKNQSVRILLSSEVGAEGLDFQFCDILFNYDLPWNPMQVEQRIGRLDRFGQKHPRIRIYNLFLEDTIETRIFDRLYSRIHLFERSIGDLEEILGEEIRELSRKVIQRRLTPEEERRLADQAAQRIENRARMEAEVEEHREAFLGLSELFDQRVSESVRRGSIITGNEVRALVVSFLRQEFPNARIRFDDEEPCATIEIDRALADHLWRTIDPRRTHISDRLREAMAKCGRLAVTFDDDLASQRPALEFLTIRHPLTQAAIRYWQEQIPEGFPCASIAISGPAEEAGDGSFFIYLLSVRSVNSSVTLEPVIVLDDGRLAPQSAEILLSMLQQSTGVPRDRMLNDEKFAAALERAADEMARHRKEVEARVRQKNEVLVASRKASVKSSFEAKIRRAEHVLETAHDPRIIRMKQSEIQHLHAKMKAKLGEIERGQEVAVSSTLLAGGRIRIVPSAPPVANGSTANGRSAVGVGRQT